MDCLFIGHNEMDFRKYKDQIEIMGIQSGAYKDLELNFFECETKLYTMTKLINELYPSNEKLTLNSILNLTIAYLGSYLDRQGLSFDYVNSFNEEKQVLKEKLEKDILAVAIPTTLYLLPMPLMEIVEFVRKYNDKVPIIVGGPYIATQVQMLDEIALEYFFDMIGADFYINNSQGEQALVNILKCLKENRGVESIPNVISKNRGSYYCSRHYNEDNRLANNGINWSLFKNSKKSVLSIRTTISCPYACNFCAFPQHAGKYQWISEQNFRDELEKINALGFVRRINFVDDSFNIPVDRFKDFLKILIKNRFNYKWNAQLRCQYIDEETVKLMKESGCEGVFLGLESGSQKILNNMNKKTNLRQYDKIVSLLKKYGIITYTSFIVGFPGETEKTAYETSRFIEYLSPDFYRTQIWYCDPITPIWKLKETYGIKNSQFEWEHNSMNAKTAAEIVEYNFLNIKGSIWLPQNQFDYPSIFLLLNIGWTISEIKKIIIKFNKAISIKLKNKNKVIDRKVYNELFLDNRVFENIDFHF